ncbi:MAG: sensor histidine kinase [Anaerolineaceae bacterium]
MKHRFFEERPYWWPENEPWPPSGRHGHFRRGHFFRRIGLLFVILNIGFAVIIVLALGLLGHYFGYLHIPVKGPWILPVIIIAILTGLGFLSMIGRRLRNMSAPFSDLVSAADRVAEKDYAVRVVEKGPGEVRSLAHAFNSMAASLETRDKERRNLFADVSHELRTPLTVIQGNVEGMIDGIYPRDETHLKAILEQSQVLSRLVDDLRTLALAESGSLALRREPTDLAVLASDIAASFHAQALEVGLAVKVEPAGELPLIDLDPVRMREVLSNLIANAMRYSTSGSEISLQLSRIDQPRKSVQIISIHDRGKGISVEDLPHIFDRFYKTRDSSGLGLGLSIARNLVEAHGGSIQAESRPGGGTSIRVNLPEEN